MDNPELKKQLDELRKKKKEMVHDFTRKSVDAINLSEKATMTHMSIVDSNCTVEIKKKKKEEEEPQED
jgi:hypothetical protein